MKYFKQIKEVSWLETAVDTIWIQPNSVDYMIPEDGERTMCFPGVIPSLIDDKDWVWEEVEIIDINN